MRDPCAAASLPAPGHHRSGASGAGTVPSIQRSGCNTAALDARTTACDCRRRRKPPLVFMTFPRPRLCLGQKWNPVPEIKYNTFHVRVNAGNRPDYRFFPGNWRFFSTCTSLLYKFHRRIRPSTLSWEADDGTGPAVCRDSHPAFSSSFSGYAGCSYSMDSRPHVSHFEAKPRGNETSADFFQKPA